MGLRHKRDNYYFGKEFAMGCDIHFTVERKVKDKWIGVYSSDLTPRMPSVSYDHHEIGTMTNVVPAMKNRNYSFFTALAGVRGDGPEAKGVPDDMSDLTSAALDTWGNDDHSHSWDTFEDFMRLHITSTNSRTYKALAVEALKGGNGVLDALFWETETDRRENMRVIYWFDN
jgi:hypothetical protein